MSNTKTFVQTITDDQGTEYEVHYLLNTLSTVEDQDGSLRVDVDYNIYLDGKEIQNITPVLNEYAEAAFETFMEEVFANALAEYELDLSQDSNPLENK